MKVTSRAPSRNKMYYEFTIRTAHINGVTVWNWLETDLLYRTKILGMWYT